MIKKESSNKNLLYAQILFRKIQKAYYLRTSIEDLKPTELVVAKTERGLEIGEVLEVCNSEEVKLDSVIEGRVVRRLEDEDLEKLKELQKKEEEAFKICAEEISNLSLPMKLLDVEYLFDGKKAVFYFSAPERVDFRELVKVLVRRLKIKVELRQVGVRDEAKMIGGLGPCGLRLCCSTFLTKFESVSVSMAKNQGLPLNTFKLSGLCGRLMCCLSYEHDNYEDFLKNAPEINEEVETPDGKGKVVGYQFVKCAAEVELESGARKIYPLHELDYAKKSKCECPGCLNASTGEFSKIAGQDIIKEQ
ncbi:MAG: stage 0 sporulation protein [Actinobacteria bacterium]|nr:stage 0 sporulation protein [Actinomycetota bacterium]